MRSSAGTWVAGSPCRRVLECALAGVTLLSSRMDAGSVADCAIRHAPGTYTSAAWWYSGSADRLARWQAALRRGPSGGSGSFCVGWLA